MSVRYLFYPVVEGVIETPPPYVFKSIRDNVHDLDAQG